VEDLEKVFSLLIINQWGIGNCFQCDLKFSLLSILSNSRWPPPTGVIGISCNNFGSKGHRETKLVSKHRFLRKMNSFKMQKVFLFHKKCIKSKMAAMTQCDP